MPNPTGRNQYSKGGKGKGGPPKASANMRANSAAHNPANAKLFKKPASSAGGIKAYTGKFKKR